MKNIFLFFSAGATVRSSLHFLRSVKGGGLTHISSEGIWPEVSGILAICGKKKPLQ